MHLEKSLDYEISVTRLNSRIAIDAAVCFVNYGDKAVWPLRINLYKTEDSPLLATVKVVLVMEPHFQGEVITIVRNLEETAMLEQQCFDLCNSIPGFVERFTAWRAQR